MDVAICHELETVFISYPKSGSCSLKKALNIDKFSAQTPVSYDWNWNVLHVGQPDFLTKFCNLVPTNYKTYAFCRDPVDRWISTFVFVLQTNYDLFYSSISNTVGNEIANASDLFYMKLMETLVRINNFHATLSDQHMARYLLPLCFINSIYPNMEMVDLNKMDDVIKTVNNVDPDYTFPKLNTAEEGYGPGFENSHNQSHVPQIRKRYSQLLTPMLNLVWVPGTGTASEEIQAVQRYLHLEKTIYKNMVVERQDACDVINNIFSQELAFLEHGLGYEYSVVDCNSYDGVVTAYLDRGLCNEKVYNSLLTNIWRFREKKSD